MTDLIKKFAELAEWALHYAQAARVARDLCLWSLRDCGGVGWWV